MQSPTKENPFPTHDIVVANLTRLDQVENEHGNENGLKEEEDDGGGDDENVILYIIHFLHLTGGYRSSFKKLNLAALSFLHLSSSSIVSS